MKKKKLFVEVSARWHFVYTHAVKMSIVFIIKYSTHSNSRTWRREICLTSVRYIDRMYSCVSVCCCDICSHCEFRYRIRSHIQLAQFYLKRLCAYNPDHKVNATTTKQIIAEIFVFGIATGKEEEKT